LKRYRTRRNRAVLVRRWLGQALMLLVLLILLVLTMVPLAEMVRQSLQGRGTLWERAVANYTAGWLAIRGYMINSAIASLTTLVGVLFCSSLAGYTFARHRFPGKDWLYLAILALMMIPTFLTLIPAFMVVNDLGLVNSRWGLILPWIASGQVLGILICRGYLEGLPEEIFEAARIDGANELVLYACIALPVSQPILATLAVMNLMTTYNEFLWPLLIISSHSKQVVAVGLREVQGSTAAYLVACLPLVLLFSVGMRTYISGVTSGAIKA